MTNGPGGQRDVASRFLRAHGHVTHYLDAGEGPPLLLLHGGEFGAGAEVTWDRCIAALSRGRRVIAPDLLGFGRSDKVRDMVDPRRLFIAQIRELIHTLCLGPVDVVGTSLSARLVLDVVAHESPEWDVGSIVAIGLGLRPPSREVRAALGSFDGSEASMRSTMRLLFHHPETVDDPDQLARRMELALLPGAWQFGRAAGLGRPKGTPAEDGPPRPRYDVIDRPTLLLVGEHDAIVPSAEVDALAAAIPGARQVVVLDSGHYPQVERADATATLIEDFLDEQAPEEANDGP